MNSNIRIGVKVGEKKNEVTLSLSIPGQPVKVIKEINGEFTEERTCDSQNINFEITGSSDGVLGNTFKVYGISGDSDLLGEITLAYVSESFLRKSNQYELKHGYMYITRCTFILQHPEDNIIAKPDDIVVIGKNRQEIIEMISHHLPAKTGLFNQPGKFLEKAEVITEFLYEIMDDFGLSNSIDGQDLSLIEKLKILKEKKGKVLCQGLRDIFIELFLFLDDNVKLRKCHVFRYFPEIENVMLNSHALLEINISNEWVAYDPTLRVYFSDKAGKLLSVVDIWDLKCQNNLDSIVVNHINTRKPKSDDFELEKDPFDPYNYNYFSTFGVLEFIGLQVYDYYIELEKSEKLIQENELEEAEIIINTVLLANKNDIEMLNNLAVIKILSEKLNSVGEALTIIEKILQLDPTNEIALENLRYIRGE